MHAWSAPELQGSKPASSFARAYAELFHQSCKRFELACVRSTADGLGGRAGLAGALREGSGWTQQYDSSSAAGGWPSQSRGGGARGWRGLWPRRRAGGKVTRGGGGGSWPQHGASCGVAEVHGRGTAQAAESRAEEAEARGGACSGARNRLKQTRSIHSTAEPCWPSEVAAAPGWGRRSRRRRRAPPASLGLGVFPPARSRSDARLDAAVLADGTEGQFRYFTHRPVGIPSGGCRKYFRD